MKARRMRRHNLRQEKQRRRRASERAALKDQVNAAVKDLFASSPDVSRIAVEDLWFRGKAFRTATLNRRLLRWMKGHLQRRLMYVAELNGVELVAVNAAYTSQTCPRCWFTASTNRTADRFECRSCGYTGSADAVAATNVLRRGSDPVITRFTPKRIVKRILEERWRSARIGSAWGSNEVPLAGPDRAAKTAGFRRAKGDVKCPPRKEVADGAIDLAGSQEMISTG
jgi:IS605 OrfB family transposase